MTCPRAVEDACGRYPLDPKRLTLVALSNGGTGATRAIATHRELFSRAVLISAALEQDPIWRGRSAGAWEGLPVLVIHGEADRRIPVANIRRRAAELERGGLTSPRGSSPEPITSSSSLGARLCCSGSRSGWKRRTANAPGQGKRPQTRHRPAFRSTPSDSTGTTSYTFARRQACRSSAR